VAKVRVFERVDGGVTVIHPVYKNKLENETDDEYLDRISVKHMKNAVGYPDNVVFVDIDAKDLPADRADRDAWKINKAKGCVVVDKVKAKKIKLERDAAKKIQQEIKSMAIERLKARGELPADFGL